MVNTRGIGCLSNDRTSGDSCHSLGRLSGSTVEHLLHKIPCTVWVVYAERQDE